MRIVFGLNKRSLQLKNSKKIPLIYCRMYTIKLNSLYSNVFKYCQIIKILFFIIFIL